AGVLEGGQAIHRLAVADERDGEFDGIQDSGIRAGVAEGESDFLDGGAGVPAGADRSLRPTLRVLASGALRHRGTLDLDELVHQAGGWRAGSGHHGGAHAEAIHRFAAQRSDGELVHIAGDDDLRVVRAQGIKLVADLLSEYTE